MFRDDFTRKQTQNRKPLQNNARQLASASTPKGCGLYGLFGNLPENLIYIHL